MLRFLPKDLFRQAVLQKCFSLPFTGSALPFSSIVKTTSRISIFLCLTGGLIFHEYAVRYQILVIYFIAIARESSLTALNTLSVALPHIYQSHEND